MSLTKIDVERIVSNAVENMKNSIITEITALIDEKLEPVNTELNSIRESLNNNHGILLSRIEALENENLSMKKKHAKEQVKLLDLQIHSMKRNLIVPNIEEDADPASEDTDKLIFKLKQILKEKVNMPPEKVDSITFTAAHRLGNRNTNRARSTIFVFLMNHHVSETWKYIKKLGRGCKYHFKSHLPKDLADYKSDLLKERITLRNPEEGGDPNFPCRVIEVKGYPQMEIKDAHGRWEVKKAYKDRFGELLD